MDDDAETRAREFAAERHSAQKYGDAPYTTHLAAVRAVLRDFGHGGELAVAAWLHDVAEDTGTAPEEIDARFGPRVAALVWAVTGIGATRNERNAAAYAKIRATPGAAVLKLADRIANAEASRARPDKLAMYRAEMPAFEAALSPHGDPRMWARLRDALR